MKPLYLLPTPIRKSMNQLSIHGKKKTVGSSSIRGQLFSVDYDLQSDIRESSIQTVIQHILEAYKPSKDMVVVEFKAGFKNDEKVVWSYDDLVKGKKGKLTLAKALMMRKKGAVTAKVDAIVLNNGVLEDVNCLLLITIGNKRNYYPAKKDELIASLESEVEEYSSDNAMKSLKRLSAMLRLEMPKSPLLSVLEDYFNSPYGLLNKLIQEYELIQMAKGHFPQSVIDANMDMVKSRLGSLPSSIVSNKVIKEMNIPVMKRILHNQSKLVLMKSL
jgi:hypothetical protein